MSPDRADVSVVIPTYNRASLLRPQLESLVRQTWQNFQVVVADDGSTDETAQVCAEFAGLLRISYHHQADEGFRVARARNEGARLAAAPILLFLDSGTLAGPDLVRCHREAHEISGQDARVGRVVVGYTYGYDPWNPYPGLARILAEAPPEDVVGRIGTRDGFRDVRHDDFAAVEFDLSRLCAPWMQCWTCNLSVCADDFWRIGGFNEEYRSWGGEDVEFAFRLLHDGARPVASPRAWAIEPPHERDPVVNDESHQSNTPILWKRFPEPVTELYVGIYGQGDWDPPLEYEYRQVLHWTQEVRDVGVDAEVRRLLTGERLRYGDANRGRTRVAVFGSGADLGFVEEFTDVEWVLLEFDQAKVRGIAEAENMSVYHAIGVGTLLASGYCDIAVVSSRLRGLWQRWGKDILAEAQRVATDVHVTFGDRPGSLAKTPSLRVSPDKANS